MTTPATGPGIQVRAAGEGDLERIAAWNIAMALETEHKKLDSGTVHQGVRAVLALPRRGRYFIAERDGEPVGTLMITYEWSDWRNGDWWWIQSVYVHPDHRRQGVYAALYAHVRAAAQASAEVCGLRLYVERENHGAQRTYQALGMADAGYLVYEEPLKRG